MSEERPIDSAIAAQLEAHGEAQVRALIAAGGFPHPVQQQALRWLAKKDQESRERKEASQASQMRTALSAKKAAWIAAIAAIVAAIVTIIGTVISILAWLWPRSGG